MVASASKQAGLTHTGLPGGSADTILCVDAFHFASSITAAADERAAGPQGGDPAMAALREEALKFPPLATR